jgi:hypothetical protein
MILQLNILTFLNIIFEGDITNAKNIMADRPKILMPTHFSCMKDIKAKKLVVGVIP